MATLDNDGPTKTRVIELLRDQYGRKIHGVQIDDLLGAFGGIDAAMVEKAVGAHMMDTTDEGRGQPVGAWPPTPAHINRHLQELRKVAARTEQDRRNTERAGESDKHFVKAHKTAKWRDELARGKQIRMALTQKFGLDLKQPADMKLVMDALKAVTGDGGLGTAAAALEIAQTMVDARPAEAA
jgi:hypothetical protein